jgi:hypothetical protein
MDESSQLPTGGGISFHLRGADKGNDLVRAGDLVAFLQRLLGMLGAIDYALHGHETKFFRVSQLRVGSLGATLQEEVEERYRARRYVFQAVEPAFEELLASVGRSDAPTWANSEILVKLRDLADPLTHVHSATLTVGKSIVNLDDTYRRDIDRMVGHDVVSVGELVGTLDALNLHDQLRAFLYPRRKGESRIACDFPSKLRPKVLASLQKRVRVTGELKRRESSERPYHVKIIEIEILPEEADLPLFQDVYGLSPLFPAGLDAVRHIRELRDAD